MILQTCMRGVDAATNCLPIPLNGRLAERSSERHGHLHVSSGRTWASLR